MGAIKTLADVTWKEGPGPRHASVRGVTDKIDEVVADKTSTATISGTWTFSGPINLPSGVWEAGGNVGIGTANPDANLDVAQTIRVLSNTNVDPTTGTGVEILYNSSTGFGRIFAFDRDLSAWKDLVLGQSLQLVVKSDNTVGIGTTGPEYKLHVSGTFGFAPGSSVTPANNGDVVFELTDNTTFTIRAKGSDGTVRSGTVTLA